MTLLYVAKVVLGILTIIILVGFFIKWRLSKSSLSIANFYASSKFVKQSGIIGTGVVFLSLSFILDFLGFLNPSEMSVIVLKNLFGLISLICFSFGYYKEIRQK